MVNSTYMLARPAPPSPPKLFLDQQVIPALIDLAGAVEAGLERVATWTRCAPVPSVAAAFTAGILFAWFAARRRV